MIARLVCFAAATVIAAAPAPLKVLIVDGQNNHDWKATTPPLKKMLEATGLFTVEVATTPAKGGDMSGFRPEFRAYRVVVLNYNGDDWPEATRAAFVAYVRGGGGVVAYHAANNAFTQWKEFNEIVALGGWGGLCHQPPPPQPQPPCKLSKPRWAAGGGGAPATRRRARSCAGATARP